MYAVVETGGKQYRLAPGDKLRVEKLAADVGGEVVFEKVLMLGADDGPVVGTPYVEGAKVRAKVLEHGKEDKVIVFKYRRKKNYRKFRGHRQPYTQVQIEAVER